MNVASPAARVAVRADSSSEVGGGHLMRCIALAEELRRLGSDVRFVTRRQQGDRVTELERRDFAFGVIPGAFGETEDAEATTRLVEEWWGEPCEWVVVDHYSFGAAWETAVARKAQRVLAVDDLGRTHACDMLVDHNFGAGSERYAASPARCRRLLGPRYALLRSEFARERERSRERDGVVRDAVACFGTGDDGGAGGLLLDALELLASRGIRWHVVTPLAQKAGEPRRGVHVHDRVDDMASLLAEADFAVGAGGVGMLERAFLGVPQLVLVTAENQAAGVASAVREGLAWTFETPPRGPEEMGAAIARLLDDPAGLRAASRRELASLGPALGSTRVARAMLARTRLSFGRWSLRPVEQADASRLLAWRNLPEVRRWMYATEEVAREEHEEWLSAGFEDASVERLVFEGDGEPLGYVGFTGLGEPGVPEWGFYLGEARRPSGSGLALGVLALEYAFGRLGVASLRGEALSENAASTAFHERLGFVSRSLGPQERRGRVCDVIAFEMDAESWRRGRDALLRGLVEEG